MGVSCINLPFDFSLLFRLREGSEDGQISLSYGQNGNAPQKWGCDKGFDRWVMWKTARRDTGS
jgi:hypothetical protein